MGPMIGRWKRTPLWLQLFGKPAMRRHIIWAHSDEWEYGWPSTFNGLEEEVRRLRRSALSTPADEKVSK